MRARRPAPGRLLTRYLSHGPGPFGVGCRRDAAWLGTGPECAYAKAPPRAGSSCPSRVRRPGQADVVRRTRRTGGSPWFLARRSAGRSQSPGSWAAPRTGARPDAAAGCGHVFRNRSSAAFSRRVQTLGRRYEEAMKRVCAASVRLSPPSATATESSPKSLRYGADGPGADLRVSIRFATLRLLRAEGPAPHDRPWDASGRLPGAGRRVVQMAPWPGGLRRGSGEAVRLVADAQHWALSCRP